MKLKPVVDLGTGNAGCGDVTIHRVGIDLIVRYESGLRPGRFDVLRFNDAAVFDFRSEGFASVGDLAFDHVHRVLDSDWLETLWSAHRSLPGGAGTKRHFVVYLSDFGQIDVLAEGVTRVEGEGDAVGTA